METIDLQARNRGKKEKGNSRMIPAIMYGRDTENKMLWLDYQTFRKAFEKSGESTVINLAIDGDATYPVLVYDVQYHPLSGEFQHIDFLKVKMDEEIDAEVELEFVGVSPAVKELGGVLVKGVDSIEVRALPGDLPSSIEVDIAALKTFDDAIYVKDLKIPAKVEVNADPETVVASISEPRSEEELKSLDEKVEVDMDQVEGMKKEEKTEEEKKSE